MRSHGVSAASNHVQTLVIGAGVVGLAVARRFALGGYEVLLVDKESVVGTGSFFGYIHNTTVWNSYTKTIHLYSVNVGISSRSSEVIHAGIYYPPNSRKARLCVQGRNQLYEYCSNRNIPYKKVGKLIVATNEQQLHVDLPHLWHRAKANHVHDLKLLSASEVVQEYEPEITCHGALFSPSTGIVDSHALIMSILTEAQDLGVTLALKSHVKHIQRCTPQGFQVLVDDTRIHCDILCNCTGLYSDLVSSLLFSTPFSNRRQYFAKGNYYRLQQPGYTTSSPFHHLIYPIPEKFGLGTHATIDLMGTSTRFGPDVEWISPFIVHPEDIDYSVDAHRAELFYAEIRKYWPHLQDNCLVPDYSGVRPKLVHDQQLDTSFQDFGIECSRDHGIPGFINMRGIESPGLTSCMAIADEVFEREFLQRG
jgi:L-2-hydroxyglutarate oxidase LhgO